MTTPYDESGVPPLALNQGLSSFRVAGVDVRLTRTNVRSGRLEISAHRTLPELLKRIAGDPAVARDALVGDPNAVAAAIASAALPVAFIPHSLTEIYPHGPYENLALHAILTGPEAAVQFGLTPAQHSLLSAAYPHTDDLYIDGGILDNYPLSPAIDAIKDAAHQADLIYRQTHDVFVVFLGPEPKIAELPPGQAQQMLAYEYGLRAWELTQNAKMLNEAPSTSPI